jgi:acyl carrier protein
MYEDIKNLLVSTFKVPPDEVTPEARLDELELDSLDVVEFAAVIKDRLDVQVSEDELADLMQVGAIADLIESRAARV